MPGIHRRVSSTAETADRRAIIGGAMWAVIAAVVIGFLAVLAVPLSRQRGWIGNATATIWISAASALATLAAVGVALFGASVAERIARKDAERSELIRHEAVRPIASVESYAYTTNNFSVRFVHEAGGAGFDVQAALVIVATEHPVWLLPPTGGGILRPAQERAGALRIEFANTHTQYPHNELVKIICYFEDSIGWWWKQESDPFPIDAERPARTGHPSAGTAKLNMPARTPGKPDMTTGTHAW